MTTRPFHSLRDPAVESECSKTHLSAGLRGVTVSRNRAIQIDIYLLAYLLDITDCRGQKYDNAATLVPTDPRPELSWAS